MKPFRDMTYTELSVLIQTLPWKYVKDEPPITQWTDSHLAIMVAYCLVNCGRQSTFNNGEPATYDAAMVMRYGPELLRRLEDSIPKCTGCGMHLDVRKVQASLESESCCFPLAAKQVDHPEPYCVKWNSRDRAGCLP